MKRDVIFDLDDWHDEMRLTVEKYSLNICGKISTEYKHTKLYYNAPNKNKSNYILKMGTNMLSTWIKGITGHNNLAYFQSKLNAEIDPTCRLCLQSNETLHHLMTDCEATSSLQLDIMKNMIPLPDMTWSVKDIIEFVQHPLIHLSLIHISEPTRPY